MSVKKNIYLIIALLTINLTQGQKKVQKLKEFTASNSVVYKVGDEIKLGRGSDTNGRFVYINVGGWGAIAGASNNANYNTNNNRLGAGNTGLIVTIKKIKKYNYKRYKGIYFTVGGGNITNYIIDIENAIATCEVENCIKNKEVTQIKSDKYDKLKKIKHLLDEGVLSEDEYQIEKKKILKEN